MNARPEWWDWELDLGHGHVGKRMLDRSFNEADLRQMLHDASDYSYSRVPGRYIIRSVLDADVAHIIVEPDLARSVLVVVTAYFDR